MKYKLVKMDQISGDKASIYAVYLEDEQINLFDRFLEENEILFESEIADITDRLYTIGHYTGAKEQLFKLKEGKPGDGVCALYDSPNSRLRLYCIRYGTSIVILGGGGYKPKSMHALQEDDKLKDENYFLRQVSSNITQRMKDHEIYYSIDYMNFDGDLEFNDEEL